ncbi:hypothetical protein SBE55_09870 [Mycolicibacterium sp. 141076]|uniref:hypothetical protein n=1 Tax=Mycobacteriaceae TaxID=1762 RepID=UPI0011DC0564|nr:hypothetical protein [Mycolicibacterium sp. 141076]MDX1878124.1 hypothetical protein [Mycolicibacterium sp. 141076]TXH26250.1 MAG: hypothetical protein E6R06_07200 [Mycobacterium sp.]
MLFFFTPAGEVHGFNRQAHELLCAKPCTGSGRQTSLTSTTAADRHHDWIHVLLGPASGIDHLIGTAVGRMRPPELSRPAYFVLVASIRRL